MVTASSMQKMVQICQKNSDFVTNKCFRYFLFLGLSASRAPAEGPLFCIIITFNLHIAGTKIVIENEVVEVCDCGM